MARLLLPILITIGVIGLAFGILALAGVGLQRIAEDLRSAFSSAMTWKRRRTALTAERADQKRLENQQKREEAARRLEQEQISQLRREHPAKLVGVPDLAALNGAVAALKDLWPTLRHTGQNSPFLTTLKSGTYAFLFPSSSTFPEIVKAPATGLIRSHGSLR